MSFGNFKMIPPDNSLKSSGIVMANAGNYNAWQYEQFKPYIGKRVLEIGGGLGNLTQFIAQDAEHVLSVDVKGEAVSFARERLGKMRLPAEIQHAHMNIFSSDGYESSFDTIVFSNVLEHIEDDFAALKKCHSMLNKHGKLLLLVPAHHFLYGSLDQECGHYRRYTKKDLQSLARRAEMDIERMYYFNCIGALGWYVNYCLLKRKDTNQSEDSAQVGFYDKYLVAPGWWLENMIKPPVGISLIAIMRRKNG